jgi:probable F420-dependent oxidoreductase
MRIGTLMPHFGAHASRDAIVRLSARAEEIGLESLWARDHLIWKPHPMEGTDRAFIDPFVALSAAAAVTEHVTLGTAVAIPTRWPLKLAQEYASLSFISGGRVAAGIGLGFNPREFGAVGLDAARREQILDESVQLLRSAWRGGPVDFAGEIFTADGVELSPTPVQPIPILYGGTTPAGVRRGVRLTDGLYFGRLPFATLDRRLAQMREASEGRAMYSVVQPLVVLDSSREAAEARIPVTEITHSSEGAKFWVKPPSGEFKTADDLAGLVVHGSPDDIVAQILEFADREVDEFVFDLRLQFDEYEHVLEVIGSEVLPAVRSQLAERDRTNAQ